MSGFRRLANLLHRSHIDREIDAELQAHTARVHFVDPGYFSTLQVPPLQGRTWSVAEVARGASLAVVNQTLARGYYPNGDIDADLPTTPEIVHLAFFSTSEKSCRLKLPDRALS